MADRSHAQAPPPLPAPSPLHAPQSPPYLHHEEERVDAPSDEEDQDAAARSECGCSHVENPVFRRPSVHAPSPLSTTGSFPSRRQFAMPLSPPPVTRAMSDRPLTVLTSPRQRYHYGRVSWQEEHVESAGLLHANSRRRSQTWSVAAAQSSVPSPDPQRRSVSLDIHELEVQEEEEELPAEVPPNSDLRAHHSWRRLARVLLVVCAYIALASQPTRLSRLLKPSSSHFENVAFSPAHGREVAFSPLGGPVASSGSSDKEKEERIVPPLKHEQTVRRKRPPALAHARMSGKAPVFSLKPRLQKFVLPPENDEVHSTTSTEKAPYLGLLAWIILLYLILETGCREAQRRYSMVQQRRMRDVWHAERRSL